MSDLISKAEVLETYAELFDVFDDSKEIRKELCKVYAKINKLPSAKPYTDEEIQRMSELEQAEIEKAYELGRKSMKWVLCSERLPEKGEKVLASTQNTVFTQVFKGTQGTCDSWWWNNNTIKTIYAWMPLPEPYQEEQE